jgi:hypothetical protein
MLSLSEENEERGAASTLIIHLYTETSAGRDAGASLVDVCVAGRVAAASFIDVCVCSYVCVCA